MRSSTIIVTYNHRAHIERCLHALLPTLEASDEVVVVDNASRDGTPDFVATAFPFVRLIRNAENAGFGAACNRGATESRGDALVFLNPDTEVDPGWLEPLLDSARAPGVGLATPKILLRHAPSHIDTYGHNIHISGIATCRGWGQPSSTYAGIEEVPAVSGACFAVRRSVYERLGGFDERLFLYYEDDDLSLRARLLGMRCVAVAGSTVRHDHAPGFSPRKLRYLERNRLWTTLKLYRWPTLVRLAPALLGGEVLGLAMAAYSGPRHVLAKFGAWCDVLRWLPALGTARAHVSRLVPDEHILRAHGTDLSFAQVGDGRLIRRAETATRAVFVAVSPR